MKILYSVVGLSIAFLTIGYFYLENKTPVQTKKQILSFEDCVSAGYIVMESYPRRCKTPEGKTFTEEITNKSEYVNATEDNIKVDLPYPGAVVGKQFSVLGKARGTWYFEASFPVEVIDKEGKVLFQGPAQAQGDWMTENFVDFKIDISIPETYIGPAKIVIKKDNPSGDSTKDASISFPITIEY
jgi:hypothetical protein